MEKQLETKIIELYLSGVGSTTILKLLPNLSKKKILKTLKDNNILRTRTLSDDFYSKFWFENNMWWGYWICDTCDEKILFSVNKKSLLNRNLKKKNTCKKCSLIKQIGNGNPFFGKSHSEDSIKSISKTKTGVHTSDHMSTPKYKKLFSDMANERWSNGSMEDVRIKMSDLMKQRIANGELKGYNRSKAEDEIINQLKNTGIDSIPNYIIGSKIFDIYIPKFNLLIEYNGDYWHCNPIKYRPEYINKKKNKTAKEIWEYDAKKLYLAEEKGYNCEVVWETDYNKNKNTILELIKNYGEHKQTHPSMSQN